MMKSVDTGKEKVKKICEVLRKETIDPAKKEGDQIIAKAKHSAEGIVADAKKEAARLLDEARSKIEEERNVFKASINLACKKSIDMLKQSVEEKLFNPQLAEFCKAATNDSKVAADLISAIIKSIDKEGVDGDLKAVVSKDVDLDAVNKAILKGAIEKLKSKSVEVGSIEGGVQVKIVDQNLTIDMSDESLKNLLASFVRDDFRSVIFSYE